MALSNAERQQRYRERRQAREPKTLYKRPKDRRSRPQMWRDAVQTLENLQADYQGWLDNLPDSLQGSEMASKLETITSVDLSELEVDFPLGFGRD